EIMATFGNMDDAAVFEFLRPVLIRQAYYITGTMDDAEDIVQDAYLRWAGTDRAAVDRPRAYLVRTVANLAINFKERQKRQRAAYFGQWLPEPDTGASADHAIEAEGNITYSLLVLMESLTAKERAVFILKEAFDYDHREIAGILEMTEGASRKLLSRAKHRIGA